MWNHQTATICWLQTGGAVINRKRFQLTFSSCLCPAEESEAEKEGWRWPEGVLVYSVFFFFACDTDCMTRQK